MSNRPKNEPLANPTTHKPSVIVDEILDGHADYSKFDTQPVQPHVQYTTVFVESEVGGKRVVERTSNILVDEFLDHTINIPPPKPKEPYVYTGRSQQPQKKHGKHLTKQQQQEAERAYEAEQHAHFSKMRRSGHIEDEIFAPGTGEARHEEVGERGVATRHTTNVIVDDIFERRMPQKPQIARSTVTTTVKQQNIGRNINKPTRNLRAPEVSADKASDVSQIQVTTAVKNACLFFKLVMKKKEQMQGGSAFSRLLLRNLKGKLLKNRILSLSSMFNHLKVKKISFGFTTILAAGWKRSQNLREPLSPTMNKQRQTTESTSRLPRTSRNRLEVREKSLPSVGLDDEKEQEKRMMALSEQAKEAILKMQRFDRYIYPFESEKHLKIPIENELRRLQKIKSASKSMWNTYYDNELTITCLYNHMKNLYELNRDLSQIDLLKVQNEELEKRIIETNVQKQKEINEAKKNRGGDGGNENSLLKEYQRSTQFLISSLNETNQKARKLLENQLKKATSPHKELLEVTLDMVNELIQFQEGTNESVVMQTFLTKLMEEQADSTRTIQHLQRQKKIIEKAITDAKTEETKNMNTSLLSVCSYLISLHSKLRILNGEGSSRNFQNDPNELGRLRSDLQTERNRIRDLESKIQQLNKEKRALEDMKDITVLTTWETELTQIIEKSETKEAYQSDIGKQRKLLTVRKDNKYNSIISLNLTLLENMLKKDRQIEKLERQLQERPTTQANPNKQIEEKYNKQKQRAETAEAEIAQLNRQLEELRQKDKYRDKEKDPLQNQLLELFKICTLLEQIITKRDAEAGTGVNTTTVEMQKVRKNLETRRKVSPNLLPVINIMESLMRIILDTEAVEKKRQQQEEKFELQRTKQLTGIDALTRSFMKLIEAEGLRVDEGLINRLRKNLDVTMNKLDKGADSPVSDLYDMYRNVVEVDYRLISLLETTMKAARDEASTSSQKIAAQNTDRKLKQQEDSFNKRVQQLEKQLQIQKGRFSTRDQEMNRLKDAEQTLTKRVQQLQKQLEVEKSRMATREQELTNRQEELKKLRADLQAREQELKTIRGELNSKDTELRKAAIESTKKGELDSQLKTQRETIQLHIETERSLNKRIGELQRGQNEYKRQIAELQRQIADLHKQIGTLQKQYNDSAREASQMQQLNIEANRQIAELHKQVDQNTRQTTDGKSKVKELSDQINDLNRQIRQLTSQNGNLSNSNRQLTNQNKELNGEIRELNIQIKELNNQIRDLNSEMTDLNTREAESLKTISDLRRNLEQTSSKTNQQNQQALDKLRQEKMQLEQNISDLNRQLNDLSGRDSNNSLQLKNLNRDIQTANRNLKQKIDEWETQKGESQRLRDELQRLKEQIKRLRDDAIRSKNDSREIDTANRDLKQKTDDLEREQRESQKLRDELQRLRDQLQRVREQVTRSKNEKNQNNSELMQLRNTIIILQSKIASLESDLSQIKFLEQANKSLKDENDALRMELLERNKSFQPQTSSADSAKLQSVTSELSRLQSDYSRLKAEYDKSSGLSSSEAVGLKAEVKRLNDFINSNQDALNKLTNENQVLLLDNQAFFSDINTLKQKEIEQARIIQDLELRISQDGRTIDNSTSLRSEFNTKETKYLEEIRLLKQDNSNLQRQLQTRQASHEMVKSLTDRQSKLRSQKSDIDRELLLRNNEISDLKSRLSRLTTDSSQLQRSEFNVKQDSFKRTIREFEIKETDLKRLVDSNSNLYNQNEQLLNNEISSLRAQLVAREKQINDLKRNQTNSGVERELQDARINYNKLQAEKLAIQQLYEKRKKDYDVILLELQTRSRAETNNHDKADQLERANERIQRQLAEVEARFEMQSRQLERAKNGTIVGEHTSPNSRYMMIIEEKKTVQIEYVKLKSAFDKQSTSRKELEDKFTVILNQKTKYLEKIEVLQRTVHAKQLDLLKNYEAREENLRDLISQNKKMQRQLKSINDKLSAQHKISTKSLEENLSKLETDLSKLRRENATLRDQIQDLEDELAVRSRTKTPQRGGSRLQRGGHEQDNDDKYLLKVDGDRMREEIYYLECSNEKLKQKIRSLEDASVHSVRSGESYRRISHSRVLGDDRMGNLNDKLSEKIKYLQRERHTLYQRLKILSIFSRVDTSNHAFIHNLNRVLDNILVFLNESEEFSESIITYGNFISQISESVSTEDYERYFQNVEDFLKDLFLRTFQSKNEVLAKQAGQLIHFREQMSELVNEQIDYIEQQERATPKSTYSRRNDFDRVHYSEPAGMASFIALQHLFRLYVRAKSPQVLDEIAQLLNITEMGLEGIQA